jgi:outer membrane usher protein
MRPHAIARLQRRWPRTALAVAIALLPAASHAAELQDVRVGRTAERTRIVLESDQEIRFSLFAVRYPDRFLLDLEGLEDPSRLDALLRRIGSHPYIRSIRILPGAAVTTLELVLDERLEPQIFTLQPQDGFGHRLVLDIFAPGEMPGSALAARPPAARASTAPAAPAPSPTPPPGPRGEPAPATAAPPATARAEPPVAPAAPAAPPAPASPAAAPSLAAEEAGLRAGAAQETWVGVQINGQDRGETVLALQRGGNWLLRAGDLQRWRLRVDATTAVVHAGERYIPLDALRGLSYRLDEATQSLLLEAGPGLFEGTVLGGRATPGLSSPQPAPPGLVLNYDVQAGGTGGDARLDGVLEAFGFGPWGVLGSTWVGRDLADDHELVRLETTFTRDLPERMASLRLGDTISGGGMLGRPVRLGGLQWATNFATQPGFITFPLPGMAGEAVLPSVVELYVNGALRAREEVPPGPFSIQHLPVVTGQGEALLVVRDLLGRERVITQPFHVSATLLRPGLEEYSYEVGAIRENFGLASNDYGRIAAVGTHRHGFRDWLTGEVHAELLEDQQLLAAGATALWRNVGVVQASLARSHGPRGDGSQASLGLERQGRRLSLGLSAEFASADFMQLGLDPERPAPRMTGRAFASLNLGRAGSVGLSYARQDQREGDDLKQAGLSYSAALGRFGFLNVTLLRILGEDPDTLLALNLAIPFGNSRHASVAYQRQDDGGTTQLQLQRNAPPGPGYGYRLAAALGEADRYDAGLVLHNDIGRYFLDVSHAGETAWRASASGGLALLGGSAFLSPPIDSSFAVVQVPGYENVRVYADNQLVARTDARGNALVPNLRAYERNALRIDQADLPLDAQVEALGAEAVPYFRSGVLVPLEVRPSRGAIATLLLEDGSPVPAGTVAKADGIGTGFPVGYDGQVYLSGLSGRQVLHLQWPGGSCSVALDLVDSTEPIAELGAHTCKRGTP